MSRRLKVGDLVKVDTDKGTIVGVFMSLYANPHVQVPENKYGMVFIIQTPDGRLVGEKHPVSLSLMEVISESR